jgi:hypothetical protein
MTTITVKVTIITIMITDTITHRREGSGGF